MNPVSPNGKVSIHLQVNCGAVHTSLSTDGLNRESDQTE